MSDDNDEKITMAIDELCSEIAQALAHCEGDFVAEIANKVLPDKHVTYLEDSVFEVEEDTSWQG